MEWVFLGWKILWKNYVCNSKRQELIRHVTIFHSQQHLKNSKSFFRNFNWIMLDMLEGNYILLLYFRLDCQLQDQIKKTSTRQMAHIGITHSIKCSMFSLFPQKREKAMKVSHIISSHNSYNNRAVQCRCNRIDILTLFLNQIITILKWSLKIKWNFNKISEVNAFFPHQK